MTNYISNFNRRVSVTLPGQVSPRLRFSGCNRFHFCRLGIFSGCKGSVNERSSAASWDKLFLSKLTFIPSSWLAPFIWLLYRKNPFMTNDRSLVFKQFFLEKKIYKAAGQRNGLWKLSCSSEYPSNLWDFSFGRFQRIFRPSLYLLSGTSRTEKT